MVVLPAVRTSRRLVTVLAAAVASSLLALPALAAAPTGTVANDDVAITDANTDVVVDVLANDTGFGGTGYFIAVAAPPAHGTAMPNNGGMRYTPAAGFIGQDTFRYSIRRLSDGIVTLSSANVTVTVAAPRLPELSATGTIFDRTNLPLPPAGVNLTGFDLVVGNGAHGTVIRFPDGPIVYSPEFGFVGQDRIDYSITSGGSTVASAAITVTVNGPVARPDQATTSAGTPVRIPVLDNDSDAGLYRVVPGAAANGTVERVEGDALLYTPAPGFPQAGSGTDRFSYRLRSPGNVEVTETTVTVTVYRLTARPDVAVTAPGQPVTVPVLANDDAPAGSTVQLVSTPSTGTARVEGDGIVFTPSAGFEDDSLSYVLVDPAGNRSAPAAVDLHLVDAVDDEAVSPDNGPVSFDVLANDWLYGETGVVLSGDVSGGTLSAEGGGRFTFTPAADGPGTGSFRYGLVVGGRVVDTAEVRIRYRSTPTTTTTTTTTTSAGDTTTSDTTSTTSDTTSDTTTTSTDTTTDTSSTSTTSTTTTSTTTSSATTTTTSTPPTTTTTTAPRTTRPATTSTTRGATRTTTRGATRTTAPPPRRTTSTTTRDGGGGGRTTTTTRRPRTDRPQPPGTDPLVPEVTPTPTVSPTPGTSDPGAGNPGAGNPSTGNPSTGRSGTPRVLRVDRPSLSPGQPVEVSGTGCDAGGTVRISVDGSPAGEATARADGSFTGDITVSDRLGRHRVRADCESTVFDTAIDVVQVQSAGGPSGAAVTALLGAVAGLLSFYLLTGAVLGLGSGRRQRR